MSNSDTQDKVNSRLQDLLEQESTRRDIQTAIEMQEGYGFTSEENLCINLMRLLDWNSHHAREIAELAWAEMYAEKEGESE